MSAITTEDLIRIEHKLDVVIKYLHGMTGVRPDPLPRIIEGGFTDGVCPVTSSAISFRVDPQDGKFYRTDALLASLPRIAGGIKTPPTWETRVAREDDA
jgi:hypothetical protein